MSDEIDQLLKEAIEQSRKEQVAIESETKAWEYKVKNSLINENTKNHNLFYGPYNKLSKKMKIALRNILEADISRISETTLNSLKTRNLIDDEYMLTNNGYWYAIAAADLKTQCEIMGIAYKHIKLDFSGSVEEAVIDYYRNEGFEGFFSEGKVIFELLQGFVIEPATEFAKSVFSLKGKQEYEVLHCNIFTNYSADLRNIIITNIYEYSSEKLLEMLTKLRHIKNKSSFDLGYGIIGFGSQSPHYSTFDHKSMIKLFDSLEKGYIEKIMRLTMDGLVSSTGWPDLIIYNGDEVRLIEVKQRDTLIFSQIFTLNTLMNNGIDINVVQVSRS